jgi:lactoylglutathione lyase
MNFLHTMLRIGDVSAALHFFCDGLGLIEVRRYDVEAGRFTLIFLAAPDDVAEAQARGLSPDAMPSSLPMIELTHNWDVTAYDSGRNFGHLAFRTKDIYAACERLAAIGVTIARPPRDGRMAFVRSPDLISVELLQAGSPLEPAEPWTSMENVGTW